MVRTLLRILLILLTLLVIGWLLAVDQVDYTPYFDTPYYQTTASRLEKKTSTLSVTDGALSVGMARVNITPVAAKGWDFTERPLPLAGYGKREGLPAEGVHDSLYVKALALQVGGTPLVIVAADMLIIPPGLVEQTQKRLSSSLPLSRESIFFTATHTHSSLGGWSSNYVGEIFAGAPDEDIVEWLADRFARAIELAVADISPGSLAHGRFSAPDLVHNRLVGELGMEHNQFTYLFAQQKNGKKAVVGIFDAHATTLNDNNMAYSADYPAYWYQKMESAGIDLPIFCAGSVGSHGPDSKGRDFEKARYLGEALADSLLPHLDTVEQQDTISLATLSLQLDMPPLQVRISDHWRLSPFLVKKLFPEIGKVYIQSARIGDFIWSTTPADYSGELAMVHENKLRLRGYASTITSFNGAYIGYVIPQKYYYLQEYESRVMSWFGPNMTPYLDEMLFRINDQLAAQP